MFGSGNSMLIGFPVMLIGFPVIVDAMLIGRLKMAMHGSGMLSACHDIYAFQGDGSCPLEMRLPGHTCKNLTAVKHRTPRKRLRLCRAVSGRGPRPRCSLPKPLCRRFAWQPRSDDATG